MPASSIRLFGTMQWAKKFNFGRNSAPGTSQEPSLTSANTVMQTILGPPFAWRWNRVVTGFITVPGQQDYTIFNWQATFTVAVGWTTIDSNGNCQRVTTAGATGSTVPTWGTTLASTTTDGGVTWTNIGPIGVVTSPSYKFGWIETSSVKDPVSLKWVEMTSQLCLGLDSAQARPLYVAAQGDDGQGNITFRLMPAPDKAYSVAITLQQKPTVFSNVGQTWSPIPDEFSHIFNWGFLSMMWLFADDPRFSTANSKFVAQLLAANQGLTETQRNIFLNNWQQVTGQPVSSANRMTQGEQARGA